jgi:hypothetical protein
MGTGKELLDNSDGGKGLFTLHGAHQVAQKSTTTVLPSAVAALKDWFHSETELIPVRFGGMISL